ncbi:MAG TPA: NAD(P)/FAD-dependent oxidoreductase [Solirubrobacteraceae bacterium]|nr:NAD(P)/FAD-dependent oxidoreductase [Solirubrobacteraceae bacterium]
MTWDVVIAGGGFGGFYAARTLERVLPPHSARVTLVNEANFMLYTPLLPGAAGATLDPRHLVVPLRSQLKRTDLVIGSVTGGDPAKRTLGVRRIDGEQLQLSYDQLIVALGSVSRTLPIPGLAEHGIGLKSLSDATALRNRVLSCLDIAESVEEPELRAEYLGFVFVGAGYAGVEGLAETQDFAAQVIDLYPRCRAAGMRWMLVEAQERIMQEVPPALSGFAARELRSRGIEVRTNTTLQAITDRRVTLSDGEQIDARTVVWTAGVKPSPAVAKLGLPLDGAGRIAADRTMRVPGHPQVWALGDCAAVPDPARRGHPSPSTAQHAIRQGRLVARNVAAVLGNGKVRPFRYRTSGVVAELGHNQAVAITLGVRWRGFPAWFIARTYHLLLMPGIGRKLRLLVDWNVALLFGRDASAPGRLGSPTPLEHGDPQ